jgi:hypothetical protein
MAAGVGGYDFSLPEIDRKIIGIVIKVKKIILDHLPLITQGQDKLLKSITGIYIHDVGEDRTGTNPHHRLGAILGLFHQTGASPSA